MCQRKVWVLLLLLLLLLLGSAQVQGCWHETAGCGVDNAAAAGEAGEAVGKDRYD
jgi:hypothetical protein